MMNLRRLWPVLWWTARAMGGLWILVSLLGLAFSGGKIAVLPLIFLLSLISLTFSPARNFLESPSRSYLLVPAVFGLAGPLQLLVEQWPQLLMAYVPIMQCIPLALFMVTLVLGRWMDQDK